MLDTAACRPAQLATEPVATVSALAASGAAPGWSILPDQTRQTLTSLLTRLLIAHAGGTGLEPNELPEGDSGER